MSANLARRVKVKPLDRSVVKHGKNTAARQAAIAERRGKVAEMLLRRLTNAQIAKQLGVDPSTITRDVKALTDRWEQESTGTITRLRAREAQELDHLELVAQLNMENALTKRKAVEESKGGINSQAWERYDRAVARWMDERLRIKERRAKLLNLDSQAPPTPVKVEMPITFIQVGTQAAPHQIESGQFNDVVEGEVTAYGD